MAKINLYKSQTTVSTPAATAQSYIPKLQSPINQGLSDLAQSATQVGAQLAGVQKERTEEAAKIDALNTTTGAQLEIGRAWQDMKNNATGAATGSTENILSFINDKQQQLLETNKDPVAQRLMNHEFLQLKESYTRQGLDFENQKFTQYKADGISQSAENLTNLVYQDPSQIIPSIAKINQAINTSGLPEEIRIKQQKVAQDKIENAWLNNMLNNNPVAGLNMIRPKLGQLPEGSLQSDIAGAAKKSGVDELYTLAVGGIESSLNPIATNPNSTASGLFGLTKGARGGRKIGADTAAEVQQFADLTNSNRMQLVGSLGREPTQNELYLAHHFGAGGATQLLNANPDTPISEVVGSDVMKANSYLKDKTVGQVIDINNKKFNKQRQKYVDKEQVAANETSPINLIPAEKLAQYLPKFVNAVETKQREYAINIDGKVKDQEAMALNGNMNFERLTPEQFVMAHPNDPEKAARAYQDYTNMLQFGVDVNTVNQLTPNQEMALVQSHGPREEFGYAGDLKRQGDLMNAIAAKHKAIQEDPAGWAIKNDAGVNGPSDLDAIIAAQVKQGVQYPKVLAKANEDNLIADLQNKKGMEKAAVLSGLKEQFGDSKFRLVARQLQQNEHAPKGMSSILAAPTSYAMEQAAIVSDIDIKQLRETLPDQNAKDIDVAISQSMTDFYASIPLGQVSDQTISDVSDTVRKIAYNYVRSGKSPKDAAKLASDTFIGADKYSYINNSGSDFTVRVPKKYDAAIIEENMTSFVDRLTVDNVNTAGVKLLRSPWNLEENADGYVNQIKSKGYWLTNGDETGASLYFTGHDNKPYPVFDKSGAPISKTFTDLTVINRLPEKNNNPALRRILDSRQ